MADLSLDEREQSAVRAVLAADPFPGETGLGDAVLRRLAELVRADAYGVVVVGPDDPSSPLPLTHGVHLVRWAPDPALSSDERAADVLLLRVPRGTEVVQLWLLRRRGHYAPQDRALLAMLAPALERLMQARDVWFGAPRLTVAERRVLREVASGLSNAEIAERLFVAPSTVRKHLENAYRKLGVTNRFAAVVAVEHAHDETPAPTFA